MARTSFLNMFPRTLEEPSTARSADGYDALSLFRNFEDSCRGWFWSTDEAGRLTYVSQSAAHLLSDIPKDFIGTPLSDLFIAAHDEAAVRDRLPFILSKRSNFERLTLQSSSQMNRRWWEISGRAQFDKTNNFKGYLGYAVDVTEQLQSSASASQLAMFDPLTNLPNRLSMAQYLDTRLQALRRPGGACAVMMIDLDRFKQVNDTLGHAAGDALLKLVAERLVKIIGDRDRVFRLGGDEFQVILPDHDDRSRIGDIADRLIASLSQPYSVEGSRCNIGASIGVAIGPIDGRTREDLMRNADLALYAAKGSGRGCFHFFSSDLLKIAEDRRALEDDLRDALAKGQLSLFYQPIVSTRTSRVTGVEALIRWHHPTRGSISPALFIPIAEDANLIDHLGEWIIRKACDDAINWPGNIRVAVNVSPIQFANDALPGIVMSALANSGLSPSRLEIELTEGVFLSESTETDTMFANLKDIGVRLALDDFGTGYSSLSYLKTAPFDKIKIDQSFVRGATLPGSRNGAIIAAIVALAGALDMETTAEGIETLDQFDLIRELGVSHIQGYVYSKPIANDELHEKLAHGDWTINPTGPAKQRSDRRSVYRKAGAIVGNFYHSIIIRNLSLSGALVEGLVDVPYHTPIIIDFGEGQLQFAYVRRAQRGGFGVEFCEPLVSDGAGGLCTSQRVSPYALAKLGLSGPGQQSISQAKDQPNSATTESIAKSLGLKMLPPSFLNGGSDKAHNFVSGVNPLHNFLVISSGQSNDHQLSSEDWENIKKAVEASHNPQLKYIIALVVVAGIRLHELMAAQWGHINLETKIWSIKGSSSSKARQIPLTAKVMEILDQLPQWDECSHLIVNPRTKKPFNSFFGSWDAARRKAGLENLSIHELRNSIRKTW